MEKILASLKAPSADIVTLERPLKHSFKDLISKILLVLFLIELNKFDLEILPPGEEIFYTSKVTPTSRKRKNPLPYKGLPSQ